MSGRNGHEIAKPRLTRKFETGSTLRLRRQYGNSRVSYSDTMPLRWMSLRRYFPLPKRFAIARSFGSTRSSPPHELDVDNAVPHGKLKRSRRTPNPPASILGDACHGKSRYVFVAALCGCR